MVVYDYSDVFGSGDTLNDRNSAVDFAGAVLLVLDNTVPYHGAGKQPSLLIQLNTRVVVPSLYTTAL